MTPSQAKLDKNTFFISQSRPYVFCIYLHYKVVVIIIISFDLDYASFSSYYRSEL